MAKLVRSSLIFTVACYLSAQSSLPTNIRLGYDA